LESDTPIPTKYPTKIITRKHLESAAKDIAKDTGLKREQVLAVMASIPKHITKYLKLELLVIWDNLGSFRPIYNSSKGFCNSTYRIKFTPSILIKKVMRRMAIEHEQKRDNKTSEDL